MSVSQTKGTALITGASAGIGKIFAQRLAKQGYDLVIVARRAELLEEVAVSLRADFGVKVKTVAADLSVSSDVDKVVSVLNDDASITLLLNNAGVSTLGQLTAVRQDQIDAMIRVNIDALIRLSIAALVKFKERDRGKIVNIGSVLGFHSLPISSIYSGTKGFVVNFTRGLQDEVADTNVKVQLVLPAAIATDIWELSGVPISALDPASVMKPAHLVDAVLAGIEMGEPIILPSVEDANLFGEFDAVRMKLIGTSQTGTTASRYNVN